MSGEISAAGPALNGRADFNISLNTINDIINAARAELDKAQAEVDKLNAEIARVRNLVQADRDRDMAAVNRAERDVAAAQAEVNRIGRVISDRHARIRYIDRKVRDWRNWYANLSWWNKTWGWTKLSYEVGKLVAWRAATMTEIAALETARGVAIAALTVAREVLKAIQSSVVLIPVDADPRIIALFTARDVATVALEATRIALPTLPEIPGAFTGQVEVNLGLSGINGRVQGQYCDNGCVPLAGGRVQLTPSPQACIDIPILGEVYVKF